MARLVGGPYAVDRGGFYGIWADDDLHYCQVVPFFAAGNDPEPGTLQLTTPGGVPRDVAQLGTLTGRAHNVNAKACSVLADRAVVVQQDPCLPYDQGAQYKNPNFPCARATPQYWVVQLSSGRVLWTHDLTARGAVRVVASRDGEYVAEGKSNGTTTIYGPDGSEVGHLTGTVQGFSWDGSLAVVDTFCSTCVVSTRRQARVIRWRDGTVIWKGPPAHGFGGSQPEPGGTRLAIVTRDVAHCSGYGDCPTFVYVVSSDGKVLVQREVGIGGLLLHRS